MISVVSDMCYSAIATTWPMPIAGLIVTALGCGFMRPTPTRPPYATDVLTGDNARHIAPEVVCLPTPGHTEGHVVYHIDDRLLFTGDTLHWNHRRAELDVTPLQTFFSWETLADSMDRLAELRVEWVFPGHGKWHNVGADGYAEQMSRLGSAMRAVGRQGWGLRPGTTFAWY